MSTSASQTHLPFAQKETAQSLANTVEPFSEVLSLKAESSSLEEQDEHRVLPVDEDKHSSEVLLERVLVP